MELWAPAPLEWGVSDPRNTLLPTGVTTATLVALPIGQTVWASVGLPKILTTLAPSPKYGVCLTPVNMPLPLLCYFAEFVCCGQTV